MISFITRNGKKRRIRRSMNHQQCAPQTATMADRACHHQVNHNGAVAETTIEDLIKATVAVAVIGIKAMDVVAAFIITMITGGNTMNLAAAEMVSIASGTAIANVNANDIQETDLIIIMHGAIIVIAKIAAVNIIIVAVVSIETIFVGMIESEVSIVIATEIVITLMMVL